MDSTPVITKFDVKYGAEQLLAPSENKVPIDLIGRLDVDVKYGHPFDGTLRYDPPPPSAAASRGAVASSDTAKAEVVFLLIYADSYPTQGPNQDPAITFRVEMPPTTTAAASAATTPSSAASAPPDAAEGLTEEADQGYSSSREQRPHQQSSGQHSPAAQNPAPADKSTTSAISWSPWFPLEFPIVLLGKGAVTMLTADPTHFQFSNKSTTTQVKISVRIGRELPQ